MASLGTNRKKNKSNRRNPVWNRKKQPGKLVSEENAIKQLLEEYDSIDSSQVKRFSDFPLSYNTLKGLQDSEYIYPTEVQRESIGLSLRGFDILGAAKTGSGKTLAFLIPVLEALYCKKWTKLDGVGALIITPTRELAYQIFETLRKVGIYHDFSAGLIIGGKDLHFEKLRMDQCNIVICTPGRLLQHMDENPLFDCSNMQILVLDEADRCLDLGFQTTMNNIIENLPPKRQTLLFSATQTKSVKDLARLSLKDPMYVSVHEHAKHSTPESLRQSYVVCELHEKLKMLWSFIKSHLKQKILVFMSSCKQVKYFYEIFCKLRPNTSLLALYGTLHQLRRMSIYESFCRKSNAVLFATDLAARGLDFPEVNWVVQLDCPEDANTYIHRAGRTARYQKGGESLLVLLPSEEKGMVEELNAKKIPISKIRINPLKLYSPHVKIEAFLAMNPSLKESAQRAFVSYMKSVFLMKNKNIFNINALDSASFSRSLGLAVPPRVRFLQKFQKKQELQMMKKEEKSALNDMIQKVIQKVKDSGSNETINDDEEVSVFNKIVKSEDSDSDAENSAAQEKRKQDYFAFGNDDSDSDEDVLKMKRKNHDLEAEEIPEVETHDIKMKKPITKAAVAKKVLKKKIVPNKKIVFNEEGEAVLNPTRDKISNEGRQYETEATSGINIEKAKQILREEDKYDKQRFQERVKAEHRMKKLKLKKEKKGIANECGEEDRENEMEHDISDNSDEGSLPDLTWLPDPDKVYSSKKTNQSNLGNKKLDSADDDDDDNDDDDDDDRNDENNYDSDSDDNDNEEETGDESSEGSESYKNKSLKSKISQDRKVKKRPREEFAIAETGLTLEEDEELALHILKRRK